MEPLLLSTMALISTVHYVLLRFTVLAWPTLFSPSFAGLPVDSKMVNFGRENFPVTLNV